MNEDSQENPAYLSQQIITYIGNKRSLLNFIGEGLARVQKKLAQSKLRTLDLFAGSGIVSRYLKQHSSQLYTNDLEPYSALINSCYLSNHSEVKHKQLAQMRAQLENDIIEQWAPGLIATHYAPKNERHIAPNERAFYTRRNAIYIDTARALIAKMPEQEQKFFLAPLLYGASVHTNTSGVFKGFHKNKSGVGQFGGEGRHSLSRITGNINIEAPLFSRFECEYHIMQKEAQHALSELHEVDFCYMDPPYNQHPYGSNYFMLNLILENKEPTNCSRVSGIPSSWQRSDYNHAGRAKEQLFKLIENCPAKYILISYNSEGFIKHHEFTSHLKTLGKLQSLETSYNTFKGSRNLRARPIQVKEYLFLLEKK